jgi:hypothetical protein
MLKRPKRSKNEVVAPKVEEVYSDNHTNSKMQRVDKMQTGLMLKQTVL